MKHKSEKKFFKNSHSLRTTGNASWVSYTLLGRRKLYSREVVRESKTTIVKYLQHFQRIITKNFTRKICSVNEDAILFLGCIRFAPFCRRENVGQWGAGHLFDEVEC